MAFAQMLLVSFIAIFAFSAVAELDNNTTLLLKRKPHLVVHDGSQSKTYSVIYLSIPGIHGMSADNHGVVWLGLENNADGINFVILQFNSLFRGSNILNGLIVWNLVASGKPMILTLDKKQIVEDDDDNDVDDYRTMAISLVAKQEVEPTNPEKHINYWVNFRDVTYTIDGEAKYSSMDAFLNNHGLVKGLNYRYDDFETETTEQYSVGK